MYDSGTSARAFTEALGAEISHWRRLRKMTREQLAEAAGVSPTTMGRIEREGPKDVADTWRLATALKVPLVDLVRRAEEAASMSELPFEQDVDLFQRVSDMTDPNLPPRSREAMQQLDDVAARKDNEA